MKGNTDSIISFITVIAMLCILLFIVRELSIENLRDWRTTNAAASRVEPAAGGMHPTDYIRFACAAVALLLTLLTYILLKVFREQRYLWLLALIFSSIVALFIIFVQF